ncbi:unnamed protein product [Caenorhabditis auriculariae]|uniref:Uncharacterized protein n=1 Tax=Caenorhabditis auriculariae TaxID=2777116 RepID=A0A8S1HMF2_9PELO|nr:unnamed protein product [Caenorhabditis auriculariae]
MSVCLVGTWAKVSKCDDSLEMAQNVFLSRDTITALPEDREYLNDFRIHHPDVKAALVDDIDKFDDVYFGVGESEAICMDPQQRMLMQGVIHALEDAGIPLELVSSAKASVYTAAWAYDYKDLLPPDQYMATGNSASVMCGRITYFLNSRGAAVGIETACSSSLVAFHLARQAILTGETELAIVCGANHVGSRSFHSLYNSHMVSPNGRLAAFDRSANGFVRAESFAVAILASREFAKKHALRVLCECVGSAYNSDGKTASLTAPNPIAQHEVQLQAMGNLNPKDVQAVTCHGTGTKLGDQVELAAISKSFSPDIRVVGPKSSLGHGEGAAGLVGVLQSLFIMQHSLLPAQLHLEMPSEHVEEKSMAFVSEDVDMKTIAISSYGFGGTNACAVLQKPTTEYTPIKWKNDTKVLFLSAKCEEALDSLIENYSDFMETTDSTLDDIIYSTNVRKTKYDVRAAVFGSSRKEIARKLFQKDVLKAAENNNGTFEIEFGEGNEKLWLLRMLYEANSTFRKSLDKFCRIAEEQGFAEARSTLFFPFKLTLTPLTNNVSRLITALSTYDVLRSYEAEPTSVHGSGIGHVFCLAATGVVTFQEAVTLMKCIIANGDIASVLNDISLNAAEVPVRTGAETSNRPLAEDIIAQISLPATTSNLMNFRINQKMISETDPIRKLQEIICNLFVAGYDVAPKSEGNLVKTPSYPFLKRRFWPEHKTQAVVEAEVEKESGLSLSPEEVLVLVREVCSKFVTLKDNDSNLLENGEMDSLTSIEMIEAIGSASDLQMPFDILDTCSTVSQLSEFVFDKLSRGEGGKRKTGKISAQREVEDVKASVISADFKFAGVDDFEEFWDTLLTSRTVTAEMKALRKKQSGGAPILPVGLLKHDISLFDNGFFSIPKDDALFMDPQHRLLLHAGYNALEKSGMTAIPDADLFLAISAHSEYRAIAEAHVEKLDERLWMGTVHSMAAGRLAALMGVRGKALVVDTTCSSVASALEMAMQSLKRGRKYAVVATSQLIQSSKWLQSLNSLLPKNSTNSFSVEASGFCRSDGVGVIILKAFEETDVSYLTITSAKSVHSGAVVTPVVGAISQLFENIPEIDYIEGHGTATISGDSAETMAYQNVSKEVVMSSTKAQFGHCEVASGLMQLMKVAALFNKQEIPSIVHNYLPNEHLRSNNTVRLPFVGEESEINSSAIVSFGITGTKTVVTAEKAQKFDANSQSSCQLLLFSAKTRDAVRMLASKISEMLSTSSENLGDIALALQKQKTQHKWRMAIVARNHEEAIDKIRRKLVEEADVREKKWLILTKGYDINYPSFALNAPSFEKYYEDCCTRLRFTPLSDLNSFYHSFAVTYSLIKLFLEHKISTSFAVTAKSCLAVIAATEATQPHYLNDMIHALAKNDVRQLKRTARDVVLQIEDIEIFDGKGKKITNSKEMVEAVLLKEFEAVSFPSGTILLCEEPLENSSDYESIQNYIDYLEYFAKAYINGSHLTFSEIFGESRKYVALPEYPFNMKSFWLPMTEIPFNPTPQTTSPVSNEYKFDVNKEKWQHVRNHVINSQVILPGATSLRLIHEMHGKQPLTVASVDFLSKVVPKETEMVFTEKKDEDFLTLKCDDLDAVSYRILPKEDFPALPIAQISAKAHDIEEIYHRFSLSQLTYRKEFQMIDCVWCSVGKGVANFKEIEKLDVLIDGALQAMVLGYLIENSDDRSPFVPLSIDKITIVNDDLKGKELKSSFNFSFTELIINGTTTVYDETNKPILHIENVSFKKLVASAAVGSLTNRSTTSAKRRSTKVNEAAKNIAKKLLVDWFEDNYSWTDIDVTAGLFDLGLTSLHAIKLRNIIKENYPNASSTCIFDYPSINELSEYLASLSGSAGTEIPNDESHEEEVEDLQPPTRISTQPIGVMAASCRLPGGISDPAELWELLKIGKNTSSRIPATRVRSRDVLIKGHKYGNPVEGGNFITQDVSLFDAAFFKISRSEAELIDPQQRMLLECVQECLENSGVTDASDVGVFVGLMEKEYQDMAESSSILSMLGSMAAVIAGRVNYVFGCHGPSVTLDTACSSSLVALEMAVNALLDQRCSRVIVAGVNLILNEKGEKKG